MASNRWTCPTCGRRFSLKGVAPEKCSACRIATSGPLGELAATVTYLDAKPRRNVFVPTKRRLAWPWLAGIAIVALFTVRVSLPRARSVDVARPDGEPVAEFDAAARDEALQKIIDERRARGKWFRVKGFEGDNTETTAHFETHSAGWRIKWHVVGAVSIHVYTADGDNLQSFDDAGKEQTHTIDAPAGEFYLKVRRLSGMTRWKITVEE